MTYTPPRWLESFAEVLVPPASREHALGDLTECSRSSAEYARHLLSILPRVVWSQVRRRVTIGGIVFNALISTPAFIALQSVANSPLFAAPQVRHRVAVPWAIWIIGISLASAYGPRDRPRSTNGVLVAATMILSVAGAAVLHLSVAGVLLAEVGLLLIILMLRMPWVTSAPLPPLSPDSLVDHARQFQRTIKWRNAREAAAALLVLGGNASSVWQARDAVEATGPLLLIAGVVFIIGYLYLRGGARPVPLQADRRAIFEFHRGEIGRQRDILRAVPLWYLFPFVPGMLWTIVSKAWIVGPRTLIAIPVVVALFVFVWKLNVWAAAYLEGELEKTEALEGQL